MLYVYAVPLAQEIWFDPYDNFYGNPSGSFVSRMRFIVSLPVHFAFIFLTLVINPIVGFRRISSANSAWAAAWFFIFINFFALSILIFGIENEDWISDFWSAYDPKRSGRGGMGTFNLYIRTLPLIVIGFITYFGVIVSMARVNINELAKSKMIQQFWHPHSLIILIASLLAIIFFSSPLPFRFAVFQHQYPLVQMISSTITPLILIISSIIVTSILYTLPTKSNYHATNSH